MKACDARFHALVARARAGDECAVHDLWLEYEFDATAQQSPDHLPLTEEKQENPNQHEEK